MAAAAAIPPSGVQGSTTTKAPHASGAIDDSTPARKLQPASRSNTSQAATRRPARTATSDYLSDKATTAFIRRTLCAQHLAEKGRNTPAPIEELLPPLTSRNDVDLQLYALISVILKEFVQKWYSNITPDETFVTEIVQIIAHCTRALEQRLRNVDLESLLLDELPELLDAHVRAYRAAQNAVARPPVEVNHREIYHSLCPLPALSPLPKPDDARSLQAQTDNETAYRQLLTQGVLALLLPTEDLENECLTSLVGQIFSELIIGNLVANKLSEPWLLLEIFIMLTRLAKGTSAPTSPTTARYSSDSDDHDSASSAAPSIKPTKDLSFHQMFWSLVQWCFLLVSSMRLLVSTVVLSRSLPARSSVLFVQKPNVTDQYDNDNSSRPLPTSESRLTPMGVPIANFKIWSCIANLLEMDTRMPWLSGALSMLQWITTREPGSVSGYDGIIDRLLSHHVQTYLLDPDRLTPLLRSTRSALFPNNAPGVSSLVAPSSDEEMAALRRRCASAIWAVVPKGMGKLYFGSVSFWPRAQRASPVVPGHESVTNSSRSGPLNNSSSNSASSSYNPLDKSPTTSETNDLQDSRADRLTKGGKLKSSNATVSNKHSKRGADENDANSKATEASEPTPLLGEDEDRILHEIESGILDIFSDAYCNKHLVYGMLELILVRLMPELAENGIIELWEERLS